MIYFISWLITTLMMVNFPAGEYTSIVVVDDSPVLVELFTSQGCSSCPPADRVLKKLTEEAQLGQLSVVTLSYHVDYWNRLGWKDPYSQAVFSQRQRAYAQKLPDNRVYTPQMVINGQSGHVGSREAEVRQAIRRVRQKKENITFLLSKKSQKGDKIQVDFKSDIRLSEYRLHFAVVDRALENVIPRGENRGRQLSHVQVVRDLVTIEQVPARGQYELDLSVLSQRETGSIVAFLQHKETWNVAAVREIPVLKQVYSE